jgi:hypothetical protein
MKEMILNTDGNVISWSMEPFSLKAETLSWDRDLT